MTKDYPWGKGTPRWVRNDDLNDSDKLFIVPTGKVWDMKSVDALLATTATVGNRFLAVAFGDGTNTIRHYIATAAIAASQKGGYALSCSGSVAASSIAGKTLDASSPNVQISLGTAPVLLLAGYTVRVWDLSAIDAAADDLTVVLHYVEYDA